MSRAQRFSTRWNTVLWTAVFLLGGGGASLAHNTAVGLDLWGNFGSQTARCQRVLSRAAGLCVKRVLNARSACLGAEVAGETCDTQAIQGRIQAAQSSARSMVMRGCSAPQLQNLRYFDLNDALLDVDRICRQLDTAGVSVAFGPAMVGESAAPGDASMARCVRVAAKASARLLRSAVRGRQRAFDYIAANNMTPQEKRNLLARNSQRIARTMTAMQRRIRASCPDADFLSVYRRDIATFLQGVAQQADCLSESVYIQNEVKCPAPSCGNGIQETGEECDDGNDFEGDGCRSDCMKTNCDVFPTTFDLIQKAIFENHGCTDDACHGSAKSGGLDLRAGASYDNLIDVPSQTPPGFKRVDPGNKDNSLMWINLAARTLPEEWMAPLRGMPVSLDPLTPDELEALRLWIEDGGAARETTVAGTADLLDACLPEPRPSTIRPLPKPDSSAGVQLHMPPWTLSPNSESEVCFASYYDFTGQVPAEFLSGDGQRFRYNQVDIRQDPLSHHLIVDEYRGPVAANDPVWGSYGCMGGSRDGEPCDPLDLGFCGSGAECATDPDPNAIACIGFGPVDGLSTLTGGGFAFAQESAAEFKFPADVFDEFPLKGVILWNSHAFNLTHAPGKMEAWVNIYFPKPEEQKFQQVQIFDADKIFWTDDFPPFPLPQLAPFEKLEVCHVHVFRSTTDPSGGPFVDPPVVSPGQTVHLFELSGHMHEHGKRFQILRGSFTCKGGSRAGQACSPFNAEMCPGGACTEDTGRNPQDSLLYTNFIYNDPVVLRFDQPLLFPGSGSIADRSLTFCALYDNGAPPNLQDVKRRSTSPPAGRIFGFPIGGPCEKSKTRCIGGSHHNQLCNGDDAVCESRRGAGDGDCDACPLTGGFRTKDEMFILFGNFWVE